MAKNIPDYIKNHLALDDLTSSLPLLRFIDEKGSSTQAEAAEAVGLARGTCNLHFQKLEHMGLIHRADSIPAKRGRATIAWEVEADSNLCLLLIFDPPFFDGSLVDFNGQVVFHKNDDVSGIADSHALLEKMEVFVNAAVVQARRVGGVIRQAFVGAPASFEPESRVIRRATNFPALNGIDFQGWMRKQYRLACYAGSIGLPLYYGEARDVPENARTTVLLWDLGVGIISGIGPRTISPASETVISEIGHVRIRNGGRTCHCGQAGCLEAYTGGFSMIEQLNDPAIQGLKDLLDAVLSKQPEALRVAREAAQTLGKNLCWPLQVTKTERLIVSGPLAALFPVVRDDFLKGLSSVFSSEEMESLGPHVSPDPQKALQTGAYLCARHIFFHPQEHHLRIDPRPLKKNNNLAYQNPVF